MGKKDNIPDLTKEFIPPFSQDNNVPSGGAYQGQDMNRQITPTPYDPNINSDTFSDEEKPKKKKKHNKENKSRIDEYEKIRNGEEPPSNNNDLTEEEKKYHNKQRVKLITRIILIVLNIALIAYLIYEIVDIARSIGSDRKEDNESYITLCGKSKKDSKKLYEKYIDMEKSIDINDYAIAGDELFLSGRRISDVTSEAYSSFESLYIANVCTENVVYIPLLRKTIDLNTLDVGDYLVFPNYKPQEKKDEKSLIGKITSKSPVREETYSLPNEEGVRRKITIKNNAASEGLVISVEETVSIPSDYYDIVVYTDEKKNVPTFNEEYKVKICLKSEGLGKIYSTRATYAFEIGDSYVSPSYSKEIDGMTKSDSNTFIREISGYITDSGSCIDEESCVVTPYLTGSHLGKKAFVIKNDDMTSEVLKAIFSK